MRIALSCPYAWDVPGGVQVHVRQLAGVLESRGHDVLVLAPARAPAAVDPSRPQNRSVRIVGRSVDVPYGGTVAPICFSARSFRTIRRLLGVFEPEVVHVHEPFSPSTSLLATRCATAPVVATFHAFAERSRLLEVAAPVLRNLHRRIAASIAVSEAAASFLSRAVRTEVEIVPPAVDVARFADPGPRPSSMPQGRTVLWVNRLDPQKGFPVALGAYSRLASRHEDLSLAVIGDGADRAELGLLGPGERARVRMLGTVPNEDLPAYYAAADVFVSPAVGQESFGIVLVEAMAAGTPVVASDIPGYRDVVRDGRDGLLVPPRDPEALAEATARVLEDPALAARLSTAGPERASAFSWDAVAPRLEAVYERVSAATR